MLFPTLRVGLVVWLLVEASPTARELLLGRRFTVAAIRSSCR